MIHGVVQKMSKNRGEKSLDDRKASLSDIPSRLNNSENINVCKKKHVEVYSKQRVSSVRVQEENTNSGGKQEKTSHVVKGKKGRWLFDDWKKVTFLDESQIVIGNDNRVYICR